MENNIILYDGMIYNFDFSEPPNAKTTEKMEKLSIFQEAFDSENAFVLCSECNYLDSGLRPNINTSDIATKLIQTAGRYCEHYASDMLICWDNVAKALASPDVTPELMRALLNKTVHGTLVLFGFRESGVDHAEYILSQHKNSGNCENYYRKIYAVGISATDNSDEMYGPKLKVTLKDIKEPLMTLFYRQSCSERKEKSQ